TRRYWTTSDIDWLAEALWKRLSTIVMVQRERFVDGATSVQTSYYVTSLKNDAESVAKALRGH
ncbi:MAG: ISAs1 family transposase, partial [Syntrophorhabdales bacterium]